MLVAKKLDRIFLLRDNGEEIKLTDPEPLWSVEAVMNFYSNSYPILATAKISGPRIENDAVQYRFESVMGTKG